MSYDDMDDMVSDIDYDRNYQKDNKRFLEVFWPTLIEWTLQTATCQEDLEKKLHKLLFRAQKCNFNPKKVQDAQSYKIVYR